MFSLIFFALVVFVLVGGFLAATWHSKRKNNARITSGEPGESTVPHQDIRSIDMPGETQRGTNQPLAPAKFPTEDHLKIKKAIDDVDEERPIE